MKFYILVGLIISFVAFAAASKAQKDEDMFIEEEEASGDESTPRNSMISDDEDLNTEGSGSPEDHDSNKNGDVIFVDGPTPTTTTQKTEASTDPEKKRTVVLEPVEAGVGSEGKAGGSDGEAGNSILKDPEEETDTGKDVEDDVLSPAAAAAGPSIQFLAAIIVGGCIGLLFAICVIMLLVYRMRKKDEGSYALDYGLDKKLQGNYEYTKGVDSKEYFA